MSLPEAALHQHIAVLGKTGAGKSSVMRGIVESLLDAAKPVCIIDPKGDWWGLKSSASGRSAGYAVVIFGGEHADVPINAHAGGAIAELVATGNRPCIIDLGGWMVGERTRFFIDFASALFRHSKGPRYLVMDEVHNFAPQGKILDPDAGKMLHWANRLASEGRGKGITILAASQRPQKVHKDFLTSCETLIAMRVIHPLDRGAIKDWIDGCPDPVKGKEVLGSLASMPRGTGWVWSPEIGFGPERIAFPLFKTYDSFKPQAHDAGKLKGWAEVDLDEVKTRLDTVVAEAEKNDPKKLRARIAELERAAKTQDGMPDADVERVKLEAYRRGRSVAEQEFRGVLQSLLRPMDEINRVMASAVHAVSAQRAEDLPKIEASKPVVQPRFVKQQSPRHVPSGSGPGVRLPPGELAVLTAAVQFNGVERDQLSVLTGYKRSSRDAYIQRLKEKGFVTVDGPIVPTQAGMDALGSDYEPLPTGDALLEYWRGRLPEGERKVLDVLVTSYPRFVERGEIDRQTDYKRSSRDAYLQRMKSKRLVEFSNGQVRASEELFFMTAQPGSAGR